MKTLAGLVLKSGLTSALLTASFGCTVSAFDQTAADVRNRAKEARADVRVRAAEANAHVDVLAYQRGGADSNPKGVIPAGTVLKISLIDALDSGKSKADDHFLASLAESVVVNGAILIPKGTRVRGRVIRVEGSTFRLELTDIARSNQRRVPITTGIFEAIAEDVRYHPGTRLDFTLTDSVKL